MLFHVCYGYAEGNRDATHARFLESGAPPPEGVAMLGRWHSVAGNGGYLVAETDDPEALAGWLQEWTDLVTFDVAPVLVDEQFAEVIGSGRAAA